jgi:hypothetical protein
MVYAIPHCSPMLFLPISELLSPLGQDKSIECSCAKKSDTWKMKHIILMYRSTCNKNYSCQCVCTLCNYDAHKSPKLGNAGILRNQQFMSDIDAGMPMPDWRSLLPEKYRCRIKLFHALKVVTNEKGEALGELLTIRPYWGRWCWMFFRHFNGLPSCMKSY